MRRCGVLAGVPRVPREQAQRVATASPATQLAGSRRQGARTGADGGRTGGAGQAGLACRRARRWQVSAVAGVAVVGGGGGSGGDGGDGEGGNGGGGGRGGGGAAAAASGRLPGWQRWPVGGVQPEAVGAPLVQGKRITV